jgi:sterol desaturase/sphingolipid hydroxylase (fatty acid hydroxylase superfamily)
MSEQGWDAIALAIPVFFLLIGIELLVERRERRAEGLRGPRLYRLNDTLNDLACGTIQQLTGVFGKTVLFAGYVLLYEKFALFELDMKNWTHWLGAFFGVDLLYYWFHRASHEVNFLWAAHIVHHQSEEYNLSVALRQSAVQQFFSAPFYWPLALLGVPPAMFLALDAVDTLYQFWIHTRTIGRLGFLESFLNTPSNHRVHHGSNAQYIDRNHGGVLIVWDKLFGTYEPEGEEVAYGVTRPLANWNPVWANFQYFAELFSVAKRARRFGDKIRIFLKGPAWRPADVPFEATDYTPMDGRKYDATPPPGLAGYAVVQFAVAMGAVIVLLFLGERLGAALRVAVALFAVWGLANVGGLFDRRGWLPASEGLRWLATVAAALVLVPPPARLATALVALAGTAAAFVAVVRRHREFGRSAERALLAPGSPMEAAPAEPPVGERSPA